MNRHECSAAGAAVVALAAVFWAHAAAVPDKIVCEGVYDGHLQGTDAAGTNVWWSFTKTLVRTDLSGRKLAECRVASHHGDLCVKGDTVYVAVNLGRFNSESRGISCVIAYEALSLDPVKMWRLDQPHGAGGMTWKDDRFYIVGGLPPTHERNYVYEYDADFHFLKRHELDTGFTWMGIQTAAFLDDEFLFGIYGDFANPKGLLRCPVDISSFRRYIGDGSVGFAQIGGRVYTATTPEVAHEGDAPRAWIGVLRRSDEMLADDNLFSAPWCRDGSAKGVAVRACRLRYGVDGRDFDAATWRDVTAALPAKGFNAVVVDAANSLAYKSAPDISVQGAVASKDFRREVERLLSLGLETIPSLDLSAERGAWLGALRHPAASEETRVAFDALISDMLAVFGHPRFFHVVADGLSPQDMEVVRAAVYKRGYGARLWPSPERGGDSLVDPACATLHETRVRLMEVAAN